MCACVYVCVKLFSLRAYAGWKTKSPVCKKWQMPTIFSRRHPTSWVLLPLTLGHRILCTEGRRKPLPLNWGGGEEAKISRPPCGEGKRSPLLPTHWGRKKGAFFLLAEQRNKTASQQNDKILKLSGLISLLWGGPKNRTSISIPISMTIHKFQTIFYATF